MKKVSFNNSGFSLIELSIVIAIVSVMLGSGLLLINEYSKKSKVDSTQEKMEEIMKMVKRYYINYGHLPCPAVSEGVLLSSADFGKEADCSPDSAAEPSSGVNRGMLPTQALGLHPNYAFDAWGNRFTYLVRWDTTAPTSAAGVPLIGTMNTRSGGGFNSIGARVYASDLPRIACQLPVEFPEASYSSENPTVEAAINVRNYSDPGDDSGAYRNIDHNTFDPYIASYPYYPALNKVVVVLISHGANGNGAVSGRNGVVNAAPTDSKEQDNTDTDIIHSSIPVNGYDDITYMYTYSQLIDFKRAGVEVLGSPTDICGSADPITDEGFIYGK